MASLWVKYSSHLSIFFNSVKSYAAFIKTAVVRLAFAGHQLPFGITTESAQKPFCFLVSFSFVAMEKTTSKTKFPFFCLHMTDRKD